MSKRKAQPKTGGVCTMAAPPPPKAEAVAMPDNDPQVQAAEDVADARAFLVAVAKAGSSRQPVAFEALGRVFYALPVNGKRRDQRDLYGARVLANNGLLHAENLNKDDKLRRAKLAAEMTDQFRAINLIDRLVTEDGKYLFAPGEEATFSAMPADQLVELHDACLEALGEGESSPN